MEVGIRVVRGPDWKWGDQDSGEGHLGTVVEIGKPGNNNTPDKTVVVHWDNGFRTNYRIGYQSAHDLRVYDLAPTGLKHQNIVCDVCKVQGVMGIRWKCSRCHDFDLCHLCYMEDQHDLTHPFIRFASADSLGVKVDKRAGAVKVRTRGIFRGATVMRGPDWDWGNQDGGEGGKGTVLDLRGWDSESGRSVANIQWHSGITNVYRLGHKGKIDLKCSEAACEGYYYREHLPVLGKEGETRQTPNVHNDFKVGDRVRVDLDVDILKTMQEGHGGWNARMAECIGKVGYVHRITDKGDVRVQFDNCANRWTFYTGALTKVQFFSIGDYVKVSNDVEKVKSLQKGHGEWTESMKTVLGKTGRVQKVYSDGDLRIAIGKHVWTVNPVSCTLLKHAPVPAQFENSNTQDADRAPKREADPTEALEQYLSQLSLTPASAVVSEQERLVKAAAQGDSDVITEILDSTPDLVDEKSGGKSALQVASHQGHKDIVKYLLDHGADLKLQDTDGDTALHYSAFGNQHQITDLLIERGAQLNLVNNAGCTALHVAVNKLHGKCVESLLAYKCDPNIQDSYGDTALHDAIGKEKIKSILDMLLSYPETDLTLKNKRGFNVLHHAALKGNNYATNKLLLASRDIVDMRKEDGYSALHLAALNGHFDVVSTLLSTGRADMEIKNNRQQTPLYLAVTQAHAHIIELLVKSGASLACEDEEEDSLLHTAVSDAVLQKTLSKPTLLHAPSMAQIFSQLSSAGLNEVPGLSIPCFLLQKGADPTYKNKQGQTPMDLVSKAEVQEMLKRYTKARLADDTPSTSSTSRPQSGTKNLTGTSSSSSKTKDAAKKQNDRSATYTKSSGGTSSTVIGAPLTVTLSTAIECIVCEDLFACVTFQPCGHVIACMDCCVRMKKCLKCQGKIDHKYGPDKRPIAALQRKETPEQRLLAMENQLQSMEDAINCAICMERRRNVAFLCGHSACTQCASALKCCHICRKPINKKISLYES